MSGWLVMVATELPIGLAAVAARFVLRRFY